MGNVRIFRYAQTAIARCTVESPLTSLELTCRMSALCTPHSNLPPLGEIMAIIMKQRPATPTPVGGPRPVGIVLPQEKNKPPTDLSAYSVLLYGAKKIGKTSLCAQFPNALFLSCEPGTTALEVYSQQIETWEVFLGTLEALEDGKHTFQTIIVDTIDMAFNQCMDFVCQRAGVMHPQDANDYGKTWKAVTDEFLKVFLRLIRLPYGLIVTSHDTEKEIEQRDGSKIDRVQPTMAKQAMGVVEAQVDIIANYAYYGKNRVLYLAGGEEMVAGSRVDTHFRTVDGERIKSIALGNSPQESYQALQKAFANKLTVADATAEYRRQATATLTLKKTP